jgi:hypothetical protein
MERFADDADSIVNDDVRPTQQRHGTRREIVGFMLFFVLC